jgi:hypothetical protein
MRSFSKVHNIIRGEIFDFADQLINVATKIQPEVLRTYQNELAAHSKTLPMNPPSGLWSFTTLTILANFNAILIYTGPEKFL